MNVHFIVHEVFEAPAALETWARDRGHTVSFSRVYQYEPLHIAQAAIDLLIVMGGPQSPATTSEECQHYDAAAEIALIQRVLAQGGRVLGVCLGAQLLGEAFSAHFEHSPNREIGVFPVTLTEAGAKDPFLGALPREFPCGHWHGDMPGLSAEAAVLAVSAGCPRQIVRYSPRAYGFQCHFEFTAEAIEGMIRHSTSELEQYRNLPFIQSEALLRSHNYSEINSLLFEFLDRWTAT
jgi:GMP synthase (glutamine-hydrolysing)